MHLDSAQVSRSGIPSTMRGRMRQRRLQHFQYNLQEQTKQVLCADVPVNTYVTVSSPLVHREAGKFGIHENNPN